MIHTYRDESRLPKSRALRLGGLVLSIGLIVGIPIAYAVVTLGHGLTWANASDAGWAIALSFGVASLLWWNESRICKEIRLGDDGMCEFESNRRLTRIHVNQIKSLDKRGDERDYYIVRHDGGKVVVGDQMTNLPDFVIRLKALNPGVHVSGFDSGLANASESGPIGRLVRGTLFPLSVIALLAWLGFNTLSGGS
jgi:hypothetical protein